AVVLVSRRVLRPLRSLAQASDSIARGELDVALPKARGHDEVARLVTSFAMMRDDLGRYISDLRVSTAARSRIDAELAAAADIQMAMLPSGPQALEQWQAVRLWAGLRPAKSVGGDLYTYTLRGEQLFFAVGDVSDKGVPAALFMARAIGLLQQLASEEDCPARALDRLNDALCQGNENCMFLTLSLGTLNLQALHLEFASAGHPAPLLLRDGQVSALAQEAGPALGLAQGLRYAANRAQLATTDRLAWYTDGITEAFDDADAMFGLQGLTEALRQTATASLTQAGSGIIAAVDAHCGGCAQSDDITVLLLQCGEREGERGEHRQRFHGAQDLAHRVLRWLRSRLGKLPAGTARQLELELLAEEIITNIEKYAGLPADGRVDVALTWNTGAVTLEFTDDGKPFNPLQASRPGNPADTADGGGLGVHLIRQLAQEQHYQRVDERNLLRVRQPIHSELENTAQTRSANHSSAGDTMQLSTTVSIDTENSLARVALTGALNTETAPAFEHRLQDVLAGGEQLVVLDMRDLDYISSAGL
ncbi:MAG: SpoIIE family protein phosphatase, partial [Halioglobus sp.]|nr:SpoIIE family protein phosphatase [Halioglobus sp.]